MSRAFVAFLLLLALIPPSALAEDGVLEINQTCAVQTGCFFGDSPGFPVTILNPGSYLLTGNLDSSGTTTSAIQVAGNASFDPSGSTIDLGGHVISGAATCNNGEGATLSCSPSGFANGIVVSARGVKIKNGVIKNMTSSGVSNTQEGLIVEDIRVMNNVNQGIQLDEDAVVRNSFAWRNGRNGFLASGNVRVSDSDAVGNGESGFDLQGRTRYFDNSSFDNADGDRCSGGICTSKRRYLQTISQVGSTSAPNACPAGFHFASVFELHDLGELVYDTVLGRAPFIDQGDGPPATQGGGSLVIFGWIRTGGFGDPGGSGSTADRVRANCQDWTLTSASAEGSTLLLQTLEGDTASQNDQGISDKAGALATRPGTCGASRTPGSCHAPATDSGCFEVRRRRLVDDDRASATERLGRC